MRRSRLPLVAHCVISRARKNPIAFRSKLTLDDRQDRLALTRMTLSCCAQRAAFATQHLQPAMSATTFET